MPQKLVLNLFRNHNQNKFTQPTKTILENLSFILVFLVFHSLRNIAVRNVNDQGLFRLFCVWKSEVGSK